MRKNICLLILTILSSIFSVSLAQYNGSKFSVSISGLYTTSAKIYLNPRSSDSVIRNKSTEISNIYNAGIDVRYKLAEDVFIGIASEYMTGKTSNDNITAIGNNNNTISIPVEDKFNFIPLELTAYYLLPFSTENFKFLMGGGGGIYFGNQKRTVGDAEANSIDKDFSFGIHVVVSMDYLPLPIFSIRTEMKFRDPEMNFTNSYNKSSANYNGKIIKFAEQTFYSKVNVDGITFVLGVVYHF